MAALLTTFHLWTQKDDVLTNYGDIGCSVYHDKGESESDQTYIEERRNFTEGRGFVWTLSNKRPEKLRDTLKELEELCLSYRCVHQEWKHHHFLQLVFSNGTIVSVGINPVTGDLNRIVIDKSLVDKLFSEHVVDVVNEETHLIFSYVDPKLTFITIKKKLNESGTRKWEKIISFEPKITHLDLIGPTGRRLERKLSCNINNDLLMIWWRTSNDEVWPWTPVTTEKERANIHIYCMSSSKFELVCYYRTETEPLLAGFSKIHPHQIYTVEQRISRTGEIFAERCMYEVTSTKLQRLDVATIPVKSRIICQEQNYQEDRVIIGCEDGSLIMYDDHRRVTQMTKAAFVPHQFSWHPNGSVFLVASEQGQLQCFDQALSNIKLQLLSEDPNPATSLDLAMFFKFKPTLQRLIWSCSSEFSNYLSLTDRALIVFDRGPFAMLQFHLGVLSKGILTPAELIAQYVKHQQLDEAVNLVGSLSWNNDGALCFRCLTQIVNYLLRMPLTVEHEAQLEAALGSFYAPLQPLTKVVILEYRDRMRNLARRFFHQLLRYERLEKAFLLAVDLGSKDLFQDLYHVAIQKGEQTLADVARKNAEELDEESFTTETETDYDDESVNNDEYSESPYSSDYSESNSSSKQIQSYESSINPPQPERTATAFKKNAARSKSISKLQVSQAPSSENQNFQTPSYYWPAQSSLQMAAPPKAEQHKTAFAVVDKIGHSISQLKLASESSAELTAKQISSNQVGIQQNQSRSFHSDEAQNHIPQEVATIPKPYPRRTVLQQEISNPLPSTQPLPTSLENPLVPRIPRVQLQPVLPSATFSPSHPVEAKINPSLSNVPLFRKEAPTIPFTTSQTLYHAPPSQIQHHTNTTMSQQTLNSNMLGFTLDPNEQYVDGDSITAFLDNLNQESEEEEDEAGKVKVVHFGIV